MQLKHSTCKDLRFSEPNGDCCIALRLIVTFLLICILGGSCAPTAVVQAPTVGDLPRSLLLSREEVLAVLDELEMVRKSIKSDGKNAQLHYQAGLLEERIERWGDALRDFQEAIHRNSNFAEAYYHAGYVAEKVDEAYEIDPETGEPGRKVGGAMQRYAVSSYRKAVQHKPDYPDAQYRLCMAYLLNKDLSRALDAYQGFKVLEPGTNRERELLSRVYDLQKAQQKD